MNCSKRVAIALIIGLVWSKASGLAQVGAAPDFRSGYLMQRVESFGTGAEVSIELQNGKRVHGTMDSFGAAQIRLIDKGQSIPFENIKDLKVTKVTYRDPSERANRVQSAVQGLGINQVVKLRLVSGKTLKGRIQHSGEDAFDLVSGEQAEIRTVAYDEVQTIWPGSISRALPFPQARTSPKAAFGKVGIAVAIIIVLILASKENAGGLP
jgi:small nuclear ribonucleoprotein (snRNP)-like protein